MPAADATGTSSARKRKLHQLDDRHLRSVATTGAGTGHPGVAAIAVSVLGSNLLEQLVRHIFLGDEGQ